MKKSLSKVFIYYTINAEFAGEEGNDCRPVQFANAFMY